MLIPCLDESSILSGSTFARHSFSDGGLRLQAFTAGASVRASADKAYFLRNKNQ